ncbi:MAG: hypothetical protein ACR2P2_03110 [Nakamurella sp.]
MGRPIAADRRRGVAGWPLLVLAIVVVLVAGTIVYFAVLRKNNEADTSCSGSVTLPVLASAGSSPAARALSDAFNATSPSAHSSCLTTTVVTLSSADAAKAMAANWAGQSGPAPGVWITDDGGALTTVEKKSPSLTAGRDPAPIATSPVVLAMKAADAAKLKPLSWATLTAADDLKLVLPAPQASRASTYAIESMMATSNRAPTVAEIEASGQLEKLNPSLSDAATTGDALDQVAGSNEPEAVPVTEADLASYNASASTPLTAVYPKGAAAGDDVFVVALSGSWMTPTLVDASTRFHAFARSDEGHNVLAASHLRVPGTVTPTASGIQPNTNVTQLPAAAAGVTVAIVAAIGTAGGPTIASTPPSTSAVSTSPAVTTPTLSTAQSTSTTTKPTTIKSSAVTGPTSATTGTAAPSATTGTSAVPPVGSGPGVTFLVDTASTWSTTVSGKTRTEWLQQALTGVLAKAGTNSIGLWTVSSADGDAGYTSKVATGPLSAVVNGSTRSAALTAAVAGLAAAGSRRTYQALPAALTIAAQNSSAAHPQRVILITDGPDQTPGMPRDMVLGQLQTIATDNPNVHLDILGVGEAAPDDALRAIVTAGNGSYTDVQHTPDLPATLLSVFSGT